MSLTIRYHAAETIESTKWTQTNAGESSAAFKIYEEKMSNVARAKIILEIVVKSFFTAGLYYIVYMNCTKDGKKDLENLKKRVFVHYIRNQIIASDQKASQIAKNSLEILPSEDIQRKLVLLEEGRSVTGETALAENIVHIFKTCKEKVHEFRKLCDNIKVLVETKRAYFLDQIFDKNAGISEALEKFLNLSIEQQNNFHLIRLLSPFLKEKDLISILNNAIESAKNTQNESKTVYHEAFEKFQQAYSRLNSKTEWFISIHKKEELFSFVQQVLDLGDYYSPQFKRLYDEQRSLFEESINSMNGEFQVIPQEKVDLEENFKNWKILHEQLRKNLASEISEKTFNVYYTLEQHLNDQFEDLGFDETVQEMISSNQIVASFIPLFFSGESSKIYQKILSLKTEETLAAAKRECQSRIDRAKWQETQAVEKARLPEIQCAFVKIKNFFIENPKHNDAVHILVEIELILKQNYPNKIDNRFFSFINALKNSEIFLNSKKAICDESFYTDFKDHFESLDATIYTFTDLLRKT